MSTTPYTKLSRKHRTLTGFSQAWLASDHILVVRSFRVRETYQRFLLSDIQAIVVTNRDSGLRRTLFGVGLFFWLLWAFTTDAPGGRIFLWTAGAIGLALLIRDVMRGPRCHCVFQTAVNRERIDALSRTNEARKFLETVTPLIQAAQQSLVPTEPSDAQVEAQADLQVDPEEIVSTPASAAMPPKIRRRANYVPEVFFGILILTAILFFMAARMPLPTFAGVAGSIYVSELLLGAITIMQSRSRDKFLLAIAGTAVVFVVLDAVLGMGGKVAAQYLRIFTEGPRSSTLAAPANVPSNALMFAVGWRMLCGAIGLFACRWERTREVE